MSCVFVPAAETDLAAVFALIDTRIRWLAERGIHQWDSYWEAFPEEHYRTAVRDGALFVLKREGRVTAVAALRREDGLWSDGAPALYIHNFAASPEHPGDGEEVLRRCEAIARAEGLEFLRLDCLAGNAALNTYYESRGFGFVTTLPGNKYYVPTLRQKRLN